VKRGSSIGPILLGPDAVTIPERLERMLGSKRPAEEVASSMPVIGAHTIVHGLLTIVLALAYAVVVVFLAQFLSLPGGGSGLAVATATLIVAALLWPAWHRIQNALNRRFSRRRAPGTVR
jgi:hypothetical protein